MWQHRKVQAKNYLFIAEAKINDLGVVLEDVHKLDMKYQCSKIVWGKREGGGEVVY